MVVIVCGVSGAGKTFIGKILAQELGWKFYEGDDFHPAANIEKMQAGIPLTDEDRQPWLESLRQLVERCLADGENAVIACSALKKSYREHLEISKAVKFVFLRGSHELIADQIRKRHGHFMHPELLQTQFETLEEPGPEESTIVIELGRALPELVREIRQKLSAI